MQIWLFFVQVKYMHTTLLQDIVNHDLDRFSHGGVNITGFQLVDHQSDIVQNFLEEWRQLPRSIWEGAGETVRVRMLRNKFKEKVENHILRGYTLQHHNG